MKEKEEVAIHDYKFAIDYFPDQILDDIDNERWLMAREERKSAFNSVNVWRSEKDLIHQNFVGFDEVPQRPHVFGLYNYLASGADSKRLIWNRRGISAMCFKYIEKKIVKNGEWLDKEVYKKNDVDKLFQR